MCSVGTKPGESSAFLLHAAAAFRRGPMGESGLSPVLELLNCRKKEAFVTGSTALGSETETDCARKQTTTKKKVRPQNSLGLQSSACRLFLKDTFPFPGVIPSDRPAGFNSAQTRAWGPHPDRLCRACTPFPAGVTSCLPACRVGSQRGPSTPLHPTPGPGRSGGWVRERGPKSGEGEALGEAGETHV